MIWDYIRSGLELAMTWQSILMITLGLLSGIVIGAIPGMTADIGIILCLPLTYAMDPIPAMMLLLGIYCGGTYGGSITAILINTPGTPANAATTLDGYPMTRQGKSLKALQMALYASFFGGIDLSVRLSSHRQGGSDLRTTRVFLHHPVWPEHYCQHLR